MANELWERAKTICIAMQLNDEEKGRTTRNFSMISSVENVDNKFIFTVASDFAAQLLRKDYLDKLKVAFGLAGAGSNLEIEFKVKQELLPEIVVKKEAPSVKTKTGELLKEFISTVPLNPEYTFDEFVRGPSNALAFATAQSVSENPGRRNYNPLFIHGGTGLGKTHLMQAIGNELKKHHPEMSVCYLTAEVFMNEMVNAMQKNSLITFRERYRNIDVLLVDDIQFVAMKKGFQEEFFNTFNLLYNAGKQLVITSDVSPKKLQGFEERLISRFEGGMVQEIELPSYETRLAILKKKSESMKPQIPDKALQFIAENIKSHVRAMEGALGKVNIMMNITPNIQLDEEMLTRMLSDLIEKEKNLKRITIEEIQNTVCKKFGVTMAQLLSPERTQSLVTPRQLAMYISRKYTAKSLPEIAKMFDKSHATILHGVKTITKRLETEAELRLTLEELFSELGYTKDDEIG